MNNKLPNIKERVLQLAVIQEGNKQIFFRKIEMSYGNFTGDAKRTALNSNVLAKILSIYPNTNPTWLLLGTGNMLLEQPIVGIIDSNVHKPTNPILLDFNIMITELVQKIVNDNYGKEMEEINKRIEGLKGINSIDTELLKEMIKEVISVK